MHKVCVVTSCRADWTRGQSICEAIDASNDLELQLIDLSGGPSGTHGNHPVSMATDTSYLIAKLAKDFFESKPDIVIALTDRYETLAVSQTAALMNIHVAHVQGGEVTGTIDESIRHAVTKLSHIHFPATEESANRIIAMGEDANYVFNVGCPATDLLLRVDVSERPTGTEDKKYILMLMHPVTTEWEDSYNQTKAVLDACLSFDPIVTIVVGPGHDAGSKGVVRAIEDAGYPMYPTIPHEKFIQLIAHCEVMVGNSSAGIREACYFGTPVVDVGSRQMGRERGDNVWTIGGGGVKSRGIIRTIEEMVGKRCQPEHLFGDGTAGTQIAQLLATMDLPNIQKRIMI